MDKKITSIMFLPVCTKCLKIIWQEVDMPKRVDIIGDSPKLMGAIYDISPDKCPHCGALFNYITIPTKLPFNAFDCIVDISANVEPDLKACIDRLTAKKHDDTDKPDFYNGKPIYGTYNNPAKLY